MGLNFGDTANMLGGLPIWLKYIFMAWIALTGIVLILIIWHQISKIDGSDDTDKSADLQTEVSGSYSTHYDAALAQKLGLDCSRYVAAAHPDLETFDRRFCEALSELRASMMSLATTRSLLKFNHRECIQPIFNLDLTYRYLKYDFNECPHDVKKEKLFRLIDDVTDTATDMRQISTVELYEKWSNESLMTLDDMFLIFGFLEWCVTRDAAGKAKPSELYRLGPFYDVAFSTEESRFLNLRYVADYASSGEDYVALIGMFD